MQWIVARIKWVMLISGVLTCTMVYAAIAPQAALISMFGTSLEGPLAQIIVRNWAALITLMGAMLIFGAFNPTSRRFILTVTGFSKIVFIVLVLSYGTQYLQQIGLAIAIDAIAVIIFIAYLLTMRDEQTPD